MKDAANAGSRVPSRFWAVVRYELLWNLRKKKLLAMVIAALGLSILIIAVTPALANFVGEQINANPNYVVNTGIDSLFFFFFALVTVMNSISGEFESGSIVPLLTKPVSRTEIFLAKLSAALITLFPVYVILLVVEIVGGTIIYGPQANLYLTPLILLGALLSTMVWVGIVLALSSVTRSSLIAALGSFGVFVAVNIVTPVISVFMGNSWILSLLPGSGASGYIAGAGTTNPFLTGVSVSTGTDRMGILLTQYVLHPSSLITFYKIVTPGSNVTVTPPIEDIIKPLYTAPIGSVLAQALIISFVYIAVFSIIAWYGLRRAQISE